MKSFDSFVHLLVFAVLDALFRALSGHVTDIVTEYISKSTRQCASVDYHHVQIVQLFSRRGRFDKFTL